VRLSTLHSPIAAGRCRRCKGIRQSWPGRSGVADAPGAWLAGARRAVRAPTVRGLVLLPGPTISVSLGGELVSFLIARWEKAPVNQAHFDGRAVWVVGPLGNGFDMHAPSASGGAAHRGGVSAARRSHCCWGNSEERERRRRRHAVGGDRFGFRDHVQAAGAEPVIRAAASVERRGLSCRVEVVTEDRTAGRPEKVSDTLAREIRRGDRLAVCGPRAMTEAVWAICAATPEVTAWFSLETAMACGVGSCHGCTIPLIGGGTARVCREGPVFEGMALFAAHGGTDARRVAR
jgi:hypothetical protein